MAHSWATETVRWAEQIAKHESGSWSYEQNDVLIQLHSSWHAPQRSLNECPLLPLPSWRRGCWRSSRHPARSCDC